MALLAAMVLHTACKAWAGTLSELLWACNIASFIVVLGIWIDSPVLVGTAFLWHACVGDPAFLAGSAHLGTPLLSGWVSILVHTLPAVVAFLYLRRRGLPRSSPYLALLLFIILVPISHDLTPPALNINMTHVRWEPLRSRFPGNWSYRCVFSAGVLSMLLLGDQVCVRFLGRPVRGPDIT